jgi:hypothetical protein
METARFGGPFFAATASSGRQITRGRALALSGVLRRADDVR